MQQASFDNYALSYDDHFTGSFIGKAQRKIVHTYLGKILNTNKTVLEINCGTGEDALFIAPRCKAILSTDVSREMIRAARAKTSSLDNCFCETRSIQDINGINFQPDIVFSDFGGLNCLSPSELKSFSVTCRELLKPTSSLVFVIMGRNCKWERFYFKRKGENEKANRRLSISGIKTTINGSEFLTYYYSPSEIETMFEGFKCVSKKPVGIFIPPSYLEPYFSKRPVLFSLLQLLDKLFQNFSSLSDKADHYLIHLERQ